MAYNSIFNNLGVTWEFTIGECVYLVTTSHRSNSTGQEGGKLKAALNKRTLCCREGTFMPSESNLRPLIIKEK